MKADVGVVWYVGGLVFLILWIVSFNGPRVGALWLAGVGFGMGIGLRVAALRSCGINVETEGGE